MKSLFAFFLVPLVSLSTPAWATDTVSEAFIDYIFENSLGNGMVSLDDYETESFDIEKAKDDLVTDWKSTWKYMDKDQRCSYVASSDLESNKQLLTQMIEDEEIYMEKGRGKLFTYLFLDDYAPIEISSMAFIGWDGVKGKSISCNIMTFDIYTKDGQRIWLSIENTD